MAEDSPFSNNTSSTNKPGVLTESGRQHPDTFIEGEHAARDATVTPRYSGPEIGDVARRSRVSAGIRTATVLLGEFCARGESDSSHVAADDGPDRSDADEAGASPDRATATSSQLGKIASDGAARVPLLLRLPAVLVAPAEKSSCDLVLAGNASPRAVPDGRCDMVSASCTTLSTADVDGPCELSANDAKRKISHEEGSKQGPVAEGKFEGETEGARLVQAATTALPPQALTGSQGYQNGKGASTGISGVVPWKNAISANMQQELRGTRSPSKAGSEHATAYPRASSVWDLDSLSDEDDDTLDPEERREETAEVPEVAEHNRGDPEEGSTATFGLLQKLGKRGGEAFHAPRASPKRARVEQPRDEVDDVEDQVCASSDGNNVHGGAREGRDDDSPVRVAVAETLANERARQLMPPPPPNVGRAKMRHRRSRVTLMHSPRYQRLCGLLERNSRRDDLLYALLGASGLSRRLSVIAPAHASGGHLRAFHDRSYVEALRSPGPDAKALEEYGLVDDCEVFEELYDYCCAVAGASIHAADRLCRGEADVAINWGGGRHHAKKCEAAGFCYVNDCVLAVLHLIKTFSRVLTIDIDVHHGDGVQEAFYMSDKGFFPGAGECSEAGAGSGRGFNLNVPLKEGCGDASFSLVFTRALSAMIEGFHPEAVVILCGADTLSSDPLGPFNLTSAGLRACVAKLVGLNLPLLMLGGGGYCPTDTARLWTALTAAAVGPAALASLPATIPDHAYFPLYGPDFRMATRKKMLPDRNDEVYLDRLCNFATRAGRRARDIIEGRKPETFREFTDDEGSW